YINYKRVQRELEILHKKDRTLEELNFLDLEKQIEEKTQSLKDIEIDIGNANHKLSKVYEERERVYDLIDHKRREVKNLQYDIDILNEDIEMQEFGIYKPRYKFASALVYKDTLHAIRVSQKQMIKTKTAVSFNNNWTVNGSKTEGKKMTNSNIKQILRSFNNECEVLINKVTYKNFDSIKNKIIKIYDDLNKLNKTQEIMLTSGYLGLKIEELHLAFEYARKKEEEKETLRLQREQEREEKALLQEIQAKRKIVDKDITHYRNLIQSLNDKMQNSDSDEQISSIKNEILDIEKKIIEKEREKEDLDYRGAHSSAGYVYIISNIGAFGEEVLKIGVTRRLDPIERIKELSSA